MGFGARFYDLVAILLSTGNTRLILHGEGGPPYMGHRRGMRQGYSLSPALYVLVVNMPNMVLAKAIELGILW
jgi:hypothetical protein